MFLSSGGGVYDTAGGGVYIGAGGLYIGAGGVYVGGEIYLLFNSFIFLCELG